MSILPKSEHNQMSAWVNTWAQTGPLLDDIHYQELREMTYEQRIQAIASVMEIGNLAPITDNISGLVEQQRLFQKARK